MSRWWTVGACVTLTACVAPEGRPASEARSIADVPVDTVVSTLDATLAFPQAMALGGDGTLYVLDWTGDVVLRLRDGEAPTPLGHSGSGPGEFDAPVALRIDADTLRVADPGNGRVQLLGTDGTPLRTAPLGVWGAGYLTAFGPGGVMVQATLGMDTTLAVLVDPDGGERARFGTPVAPVANMIHMAEVKRVIAEGGVPDIFRNTVTPRATEDGGALIALDTEGLVRRYRADGELVWEYALDTGALDAIRDDYMTRNAAETARNRVYPLRFVADLVQSGDTIWTLLNQPPDHPVEIRLLSAADGTELRRITIPGVHGARTLLPDRARGVLYLATPDDAQVLRVSLSDLEPPS